MKSIRMTYDPYQQEFSFQYNGGELDNHSPLRDFTKEKRALRTSLHDIFAVIEEKYGVDSDGVEVEFCGTQDDYDAVRAFLDRQTADQIKLLPLKRKMIAGKDAESHVSEAYQKIHHEFSVDQKEDASDVIRQISEAVEKYNDVTRPELNLVVVGTYSSGKSTFINALIGYELLPQGQDPETAFTAKISHSEDGRHSISFFADDEEEPTVISARWNKKGVCSFSEGYEPYSELCKELRDCIKDTEDKSVIGQMRAMLGYFNKKDHVQRLEEWRVIPRLEVKLPLKFKAIDQTDLVVNIYDTPGTENCAEKRHTDTLKRALQGQTNALPILLTQREDMLKGTVDLRQLLDSYSETGLDASNALVIITQADKLSRSDLEKGFADDVLKQWKQNEILFITSLVALGWKLDGKFADEDYDEKWDSGKAKFEPGGKHYRQLFLYNVLSDEQRRDELKALADAARPEDLLCHDTGLYAVEHEIDRYAQTFLPYNKAFQRRRHLCKALELAEKLRAEQREELKEQKKQHEAGKKKKRDELLEKLGSYDVDAAISRACDSVGEMYKSKLQKFRDSLAPKCEATWERAKEKYSITDEERQLWFNREMLAYCDTWLKDIFPEVQKEYQKTFGDIRREAIDTIKRQIEVDKDLTQQAKAGIFSAFEKNAPKISESDIRHGLVDSKIMPDYLFIFHSVKVDKYAESLRGKLSDFFLNNCIDPTKEEFKKQFKTWVTSARAAYEKALDTENVTLKSYSEKISKAEGDIARLGSSLDALDEVSVELKHLFEFKEEA